MTTTPHPQRLSRLVARRVREPSFWIIQSAVLAISLVHFALEAEWVELGPSDTLSVAHHIPVILYLIPVAYAGLVYGWEGGVLTGLWAGTLASINVILFSLDDFEWVLEIVFVALVVGMGIVMALPVERERVQRRRAEAAARRLEALNDLANVSMPARNPAQATTAVLTRLTDLMGLDDAGAIIRWRDQGDPVIRKTVVSDSLMPLDRCSHPDGDVVAMSGIEGSRILCTEIDSGYLSGHLMVASTDDQLDDPETRSFLSTVGHQLAVRVENALLAQQEQEMWSAYVKLVTEAQEDERRRVARDLHDGPAQNLAMLVRTLDGEAQDSELAGELRRSAASILDDLRRVARDQRPTLLDDLGVAAALEWLVADTAKQSELTLTLRVEGDPNRLDPETEVALYRIAQEAIRNAERHAEASLVDVKLHFDSDEVRLSVKDDGQGFTVPDSPGGHIQAGRLGLMGMHERAQLVGGSLDIESAPNHGTTVLARLRHS